MINLTATVIEVAPQDGYAIVRFQLAGADASVSSGDCFSVALENYAGYEVGNVYLVTL